MKKQLLLVIIALSVLISANAKASSKSYCPPPKPVCPPSKPTATHLPINSGVVFLMVAGVAIGVTTLSKVKSLKVIAVKA